MRNYLIVCFFVCVNSKVFAQTNFVPNAGFEMYSLCPDDLAQFYRCQNWYSPTLSSPDLFNICTANWVNGIPLNNFGYQYAHSGNGYAGFGTYTAPSFPYREYICTQLSDTLEANKNYCVEFYISLGNRTELASNNIGVYFSNDSVVDSTYLLLPYTPQLNLATIVSDTVNWSKVSFNYLASGDEIFITIGNFFHENVTDTLHNENIIAGAYYYIDDVFVGPSSDTITPPPPAEYPFAIYPNPTTGNAVFSYNFPRGGVLEFYNTLGQIVYLKEYEAGSASVPLDLIILRSGMYYWRALEGNIKLAGDKLIIVR